MLNKKLIPLKERIFHATINLLMTVVFLTMCIIGILRHL